MKEMSEQEQQANETKAREYALRITARQLQSKDPGAFREAVKSLPAEAQRHLREAGIA